ncbi:transposase [Candidatus Bandiella euplotis]
MSAFIGLNHAIRLSGKSVRGRSGIAKMGSNILRKALFYPLWLLLDSILL